MAQEAAEISLAMGDRDGGEVDCGLCPCLFTHVLSLFLRTQDEEEEPVGGRPML